eukprot:gene3954-5397_t
MKPLRTFRIRLLLLLLFYVSILKGNGVPHSFFGGSSYLTTGRIVDDSAALSDDPAGHSSSYSASTAAQQPQSFDSSYPPSATPSDNIVLAPEDLTQVDKDLIFEGLKNLYKKKVLPLEVASKYSHFSSPPMGPSDFDAKPMVLILGQYSVGKTSFIRSLLKQDFPGQRIGP